MTGNRKPRWILQHRDTYFLYVSLVGYTIMTRDIKEATRMKYEEAVKTKNNLYGNEAILKEETERLGEISLEPRKLKLKQLTIV